MTIIDAKCPPTKAEQHRLTIRAIANKDKAAFFDSYEDTHQFRRTAIAMGYRVSWRKQPTGGWRVWVFAPTTRH